MTPYKIQRSTVASNVKRLRKQRAWTQADLSARSGLAQTTISSVERLDDKSPTLETLSQLAAAFSMETWRLLIDSDNRGDLQ